MTLKTLRINKLHAGTDILAAGDLGSGKLSDSTTGGWCTRIRNSFNTRRRCLEKS